MITNSLQFTPFAWAKLVFLRDAVETEIGGFGICADPDRPLLITDIQTVKQDCTCATVAFDDESVADLFDRMVDAGLQPSQFARVWIHTHPGNSASPSGVDEETFERVFSACDYAIMMILARGGETYARCRYSAGPKSEVKIGCEVDYSCQFAGSNPVDWQAEVDRNVIEEIWIPASNGKNSGNQKKRNAVDADAVRNAMPLSPWNPSEMDHWSKEDRLESLACEYGMDVNEVREFAIEGIDY